ncbi:PREDICTED: microtubule-actin cross-linking factor 1, isoforms 1/2/3/5-like, partial [Rhinopithecus bieti]|uniref:microtubule-actin cross-linking factor 1, isoforms 1/2/3/5-like n=1 Tax=Rhinopithecus bieti TaxID=61621 RepID=UPI00083C6F9C
VLDRELKDLTTLVSQELECVNQIIISQPQEVPAPLLKALEKDAKNLQKSLSSVSDTWNSRLLHFQNAVEIEKTKVLNQHTQLEGRLQDMRAWVGNIILILNSKASNSETDVDNLNRCLQQYE